MNSTIVQKIIAKAIELCVIAERDELIYGNAFVEIGERSLSVIDPENVTVKRDKNMGKLHGKSIVEPSSGEK